MTQGSDQLRELLAGEIARHLPKLTTDHPEPARVQAVLHALKGSAAMAQEHELSLVIGQLSAGIRGGNADLVGDTVTLLREVLERLQSGLSALATRWPEPPPCLAPSSVSPQFRTDYQATMRDRLAELDGAVANDDPAAAVERAYRSVHGMKGAAGSVGDDVTAWYCHGLETQLRAAEKLSSSDTLLDLARHRAVLALLLEHPAEALETLRSLGGRQGVPAHHTRPSELAPPPEDAPAESDALLQIPSSAADRLLERLERVYLVHDELKGTAHAARQLSLRLREQREALLKALSCLDPARGSTAPPEALHHVDSAAQALEQAAEDADRVALVCRQNAEALHSRAGEMRSELAALRRTTVRWLFDRVQFAVERLAASIGRQVKVQSCGGDLTIDRRVAERLLEPVLQLARNAVAHGIEPPDRRTQAGKPLTGTISLRAEPMGDWLRLVVEDDGGGVDVARIRKLAVERGAISSEAARSAHENELFALLFLPGLTTREDADLLAGRGVGLQLAQDVVRRLRGAIRLTSRPGSGLTATIEVPSESGMVEVLWLRCAEHQFALPVRFTGSVSPLKETPHTIPLAVCLGLPPAPEPQHSLQLVLHGVEPICVGVDEVGHVEETWIRAVPPLVAAAGPYCGAILRSDGSLRLALDAALLAARAWSHAI